MSILRQIRTLLIALAIGGALLSVWRYGLLEALTRHWPSAGTTGKPVQFDNGSVRDAPHLGQTQVVPQMRKCLRTVAGQRPLVEVSYTDRDCPPGTQEERVGGADRVNVVPSGQPAAPAASHAGAAGQRAASVRELMLGPDSQKLQAARDQQMDKAVNR